MTQSPENSKVTWLMPVKNGMPFLPQTLESIAAQTYTNWEVLAWDNGSDDGSLEVLRDWIPSRLPGRVVSNQPLSLASSLAEMVRVAQTEFCARIDADDISFPQRLEKQVAFLEAHPEVAVLGTQTHALDAEGIDHGPFFQLPTSHHEIVNFMFRENPLSHPSVMFRRSAVLDAGNYHEYRYVEDFDLWMRMAARFKIANLSEHLIGYRLHDQSVTRIATEQKVLFDARAACFARNAHPLFGCDEKTAQNLMNRKTRLALPAIKSIANFLEKQHGSPNPLRSPFFHEGIRLVVNDSDFVTRFWLLLLHPHRSLRRTLVEYLSGQKRAKVQEAKAA